MITGWNAHLLDIGILSIVNIILEIYLVANCCISSIYLGKGVSDYVECLNIPHKNHAKLWLILTILDSGTQITGPVYDDPSNNFLTSGSDPQDPNTTNSIPLQSDPSIASLSASSGIKTSSLINNPSAVPWQSIITPLYWPPPISPNTYSMLFSSKSTISMSTLNDFEIRVFMAYVTKHICSSETPESTRYLFILSMIRCVLLWLDSNSLFESINNRNKWYELWNESIIYVWSFDRNM